MSHCTDTIKTQECTASTIECPETCPDDWTEEACSVTCGNGKRTETRIIGAGINADAFCDRVRTVDCQMEPCPVDCVLGDWMAEGECSKPCGAGIQVYVKPVLRDSDHGGEACGLRNDAKRYREDKCNVRSCDQRRLTKVVFELQGEFEVSPTELHEHRMIHTIAEELGIATSSVVVRFSSSAGRRLEENHVTAFLRTEEVIDPDKAAEGLRTKLIDFINSGRLYDKLLTFGFIFSGLTGVKVSSSTCCQLYDPIDWDGTSIPPLKPADMISDENQAFEHEQEVKEYLPESFVISVNVVVGVVGVDKRRKSIMYPNGEPVYRGTDFTTNEAQVHLAKLCDFEDSQVQKFKLHVREVQCFITEFNKWLEEEGLGEYPKGDEFAGLLKSWALTPNGRRWDGFFGFVDDELTWIRIQVVTDVPKKKKAEEILQLMDEYDKVIEFRNAMRPNPDLEAWASSPSFVIAETENGIISSTFWCTLVSLTCALITIFFFTSSAILALTVVLTVSMVVACQAATMFVGLGWDFGAIEAISVILFVGFSVDYTIHFAEAFHQQGKVEIALQRVARAIVSAGATTAGSAAFLGFCTIQIFNRFGLAVVLNTLWSLLFALVFYPALLDSIPIRYIGQAYMPQFGEDEDETFGSAGPIENSRAQHEEELSTNASTTRTNAFKDIGTTELGRSTNDYGLGDAGTVLGAMERSDPELSQSRQIEAARAARARFNEARTLADSRPDGSDPEGLGAESPSRPESQSRARVSIEPVEMNEEPEP